MTDTPPATDHGKPSRRARWLVLGVLLLATIAGAWQLAFLCDDAFITFRYVSNAHDGLGLVWNAPPFAPVEGYTGFLWAMLLWATWSWFGVEPPAAANVLSLLCGVVQFAIVAAAALRLRARDGTRLPDAAGLLALAAIAGNRTFLQWMTSGLETALFDAAFVGWVLHAFRAPERRGAAWLATWSAAAAIAALTRPDGLLLVAATVAVAALALVRRRRRPWPTLLCLAPLLTVVAHLVWRRSFYGEWLPNTYYAKVTAPWPEAGLRYFASFAVEHGVWLWLPLAALWLGVECTRSVRGALRIVAGNLPAAAAVAATLFHLGYYVFRVGGDHFEYRVFSHLVPLGVLSAAAMAADLRNGARAPIVAVACLWLASGVGWLHLALTRDMPVHGFKPVAPQLPAIVRPLARWFDRQQAWLLFRNIGLRCNHHALLLERFQQPFPRRLHVTDRPDPFPMFATGAVGTPGWCLPDCAVLDLHGLNDWVIARTPVHGFGPPLTSERLRPLIAAADLQNDGYLDAGELHAAIGALSGGTGQGDAADYLVSIVLAIYAHERPDALTLAEAEGIGDSLGGARSMAHERHPPDGYVEAWAPNVVVHDGVATARAREVPLTAERVRAIEAEWRDKVRTLPGR
ncbi:MAG TPA: hypothetical protein VFZ65_16150 [Planctomycetota bacterium]|nr:hypothetical protein [Planctomycetota bacterium]